MRLPGSAPSLTAMWLRIRASSHLDSKTGTTRLENGLPASLPLSCGAPRESYITSKSQYWDWLCMCQMCFTTELHPTPNYLKKCFLQIKQTQLIWKPNEKQQTYKKNQNNIQHYVIHNRDRLFRFNTDASYTFSYPKWRPLLFKLLHRIKNTLHVANRFSPCFQRQIKNRRPISLR